MKKSKQAYCNKFFEKNWNNIKNTWKEVKSLISLKTVASSAPTVLPLDNSVTIAINYHAFIAEHIRKSVIVQYFCYVLVKKK